MLEFVEQECQADDRQAKIVIAGSLEELNSAAVTKLALQKAGSMGLTRPGISSQVGPYPVDAAGKTSDALCLGQGGPVAGYRKDFDVRGGI
jgi:hypothetical protein